MVTAHDIDELPVIDFLDPAFSRDPIAPFRPLFGHHRLATDAYGYSRILFGFDDVEALLKDPRVGVTDYAGAGDGPLMTFLSSQMLGYDPPEHTRLRRLVSRAFTPRRVEQLRPRIRALVSELLDRAEERGRFDAIADLGFPMPVLVIGEMLGVDPDANAQIQEWSGALAAAFNPMMDAVALARADEAVLGLRRFLGDLIDTRRANPGTAILDDMIAAEEAGDRLSHEELICNALLLLFAGHETTKNLIGNGLLLLLQHPDQLERLRREPDLVPNAVEEILRVDPPVGLVGRRALADLEIDGIPIPAGTTLAFVITAANRDPARFAEPDRFDVARADVGHVSFGTAPHYCLGGPLARIEGAEVLRGLLERFPSLSLGDGDVARHESFVIRGIDRLDVLVT
jgi:cytochrome P450